MSISPNGTEIEESVHPNDRAAKKAEELLPCICDKVIVKEFGHLAEPCKHRPAVAAELRALYEKLNQKDDEYEQQCKHAEAEIARLRTELAKGKS